MTWWTLRAARLSTLSAVRSGKDFYQLQHTQLYCPYQTDWKKLNSPHTMAVNCIFSQTNLNWTKFKSNVGSTKLSVENVLNKDLMFHPCILTRVQWGHEYRTHLGFKWSKVVPMLNGSDFIQHSKTQQPNHFKSINLTNEFGNKEALFYGIVIFV